jgi:hypothetical protein
MGYFSIETRVSSVGIETRYELDGPRIESRWGRHFPHCPDRPWDPPILLNNGYRVPEVKRPGRGAEHPPPSNTEIKERVELYICSPSGPSWPLLGLTLPLLTYSMEQSPSWEANWFCS